MSDGFADEEQGPPKNRAYWSDKGGKFYHENMARDLIDLRSARFIDGMPAIWDGLAGRYRIGYAEWDAAIVDLTSGTSTRQRREVADYLNIIAPRCRQGDPHLIACANGIVNPWAEGYDEADQDGNQLGLAENDPELNIPNVLPVNWNPNAYDAATDKALDAFANYDPETRLNLEEILAACVYRGREVQTMAVAVGTGGNGKSVFMRMLEGLLGADNYSTVDLRDIGRRFMQAPLVGVLANLGDDISDGLIEAAPLSIIKKVVSADTITVEEKYRSPQNFRPYASLVFAANEFPRLADYTTGMLDRIHGVRFTADFRHNPERRVTNMAELLDTDQSRQYLLRLAMTRLPNLVRRGSYTPTAYSVAMRDGLQKDNDSVSYWIDSDGIRANTVSGRSVSSVYLDYKSFCEGAGRRPVEQRAFTVRVNRYLGTRTAKNVYELGRQVRGFYAD